MLTAWYRSGGKTGVPLAGQAIIELAFALGKMPDEIEACDETWVNKMLASMQAKNEAARKKR